MNFFQAQEQARRRTSWLILWFIGGVLGTVASFFALVVVLVESLKKDLAWQGDWWNQPIAIWTAGIVMLVVMAGSFFKLSQLSQGGSVIAIDLGARPIDMTSQQPAERQLLNVVEEMAIASGIPMPQVWVMDQEDSINAFAAGTEPANAVIGVSRGCLLQLNRDELQGVIAHEFSHILNGDMRLNVRLIGWVFGLLMIAITGRGLMSMIRFFRSRDSKEQNTLILVCVAAGVCLWLIGSLGVLFGRIIQSAVSRQREFLADASAVQFTRNPHGIAGALKKIMMAGTCRLSAPAASEAAHLFFTSGVSHFCQKWMATHPPLDERIRAIDCQWSAQSVPIASPPSARLTDVVSAFSGIMSSSDAQLCLAQAQELHNTMAHRGALGGVEEAKGLVLAMLATFDETSLPEISQSAEAWASIRKWRPEVASMTSAEKMAWIDVSFPWLRQMNTTEYRSYCTDLQAWIEADQYVSLFEWMLFHAIRRHLHGFFEHRKPRPIMWHELSQVEEPLADLLACFRSVSHDPSSKTLVAEEYHRVTQRALPERPADLARVDAVLQTLEQSSPLLKNEILRLCKMAVEADRIVREEEWQILRATADALGLPLPC